MPIEPLRPARSHLTVYFKSLTIQRLPHRLNLSLLDLTILSSTLFLIIKHHEKKQRTDVISPERLLYTGRYNNEKLFPRFLSVVLLSDWKRRPSTHESSNFRIRDYVRFCAQQLSEGSALIEYSA